LITLFVVCDGIDPRKDVVDYCLRSESPKQTDNAVNIFPKVQYAQINKTTCICLNEYISNV